MLQNGTILGKIGENSKNGEVPVGESSSASSSKLLFPILYLSRGTEFSVSS